MAGICTRLLNFAKCSSLTGIMSQRVRPVHTDWRMIKDIKKRNTVKEYAVERLRVNALRKNNVLPREIREIADKEIAAFPINAHPSRIHDRCVITSRPRGLIRRWHLSRIAFRHLADYNKLAGIQRAMW